MDVEQLVKDTISEHNMWCSVLETFAVQAVRPRISGTIIVRRPRLVIKSNATRAQGKYRRGVCYYSLPYMMLDFEEYKHCIAHEVCHGYQWQIMRKSKPHGDFFFFLLRVVCGFEKAERCHHVNVKRVKKFATLLLPYEKNISDIFKEYGVHEDQMQDV